MHFKTAFATILTAACLTGSVGCNRDSATDADLSNAANPTPDVTDHLDHDHDQDHDEARDHSVAGHAHGTGPHGGTIADWGGGKYHVEFTVDHDKAQATAYVLGGDEKTPSPIDADSIELSLVDPEILVTLQAAPQSDDSDGKASRFIGTHEKLGVVKEYEGTMTGVIDGTPYSGDFKE